MLDNLSSRFVDGIFSMKKEKWWLVLIVLLGLILRIIAANNLGDSADSMHFVTHAINFLESGKLETYDQASGLWFQITSLFYNIFGIGPWAARLPAIIFGTATIFLIYLLTREFYSEKVAIVAALLLALAPFHIKNTYAEMDVMAMFFSIGGMLFFAKAVKEAKKIQYLLSGIFLGLAIYTKLYPLFFAASMLIYLVVDLVHKKKFPNGNLILGVLIWGLVMLFFFAPALTHNYLMYKEHGFMDLPFTNTFGIGMDKAEAYYGFDPIFGEKNDWHGFFFGGSKHGDGVYTGPLFLFILGFMVKATPIIMIAALLGLLWGLFTKKFRYPVFFIISIIIIYPYLGSIIPLAKHFVFLEILAIPFAAFFFEGVREKIMRDKINVKIKASWFYFVLAIILVLFLGLRTSGTFGYMYGEGYTTSFFELKNSELNKDALYVVDSRIYRGQINWLMYDRAYLEGMEFIELYNKQSSLPGNKGNIDVYYIECVYDDCGWGTIAGQPEFNATMEQLTSSFASISQVVGEIEEPVRGKFAHYPLVNNGGVLALRVYKTNLAINENIIGAAIRPREWFLYTIGYPNPKLEFDSLSENSVIDSTMYSIAKLIARISMVFAFLSVLFVIYSSIFSQNRISSQRVESSYQHHPSPLTT